MYKYWDWTGHWTTRDASYRSTLALTHCSYSPNFTLPPYLTHEVDWELQNDNHPQVVIVDYTNNPTYKLAKFLSRIIKPLQKDLVSNVIDSFHFTDFIKTVKLNDDETFLSFDVTSLYTSVPISESVNIIEKLLDNDTTLESRTPLSPSDITQGIELCLRSTYFTFKRILYKQTDGVAMGSPIAPIVANIFMGHLETQALNNFMNPPRIFIRYVDDTFVIMKRAFYTEFLSFLNCLCNSIKFTMELANTDNYQFFRLFGQT